MVCFDSPNQVPIYASGGVCHAWYDKGEEELIEEALRYKAAGYDTFKFRNGTSWKSSGMTLDQYIVVLEHLREAVGPDFKLVLEADKVYKRDDRESGVRLAREIVVLRPSWPVPSCVNPSFRGWQVARTSLPMASGTPMSSVTRLDSDGDSGSFIEFELAIQVGRCDGWRSGGQADAVEVGDDRARLGESGDDLHMTVAGGADGDVVLEHSGQQLGP